MHDLICVKPFCTADEAAVLEAVLEEAGIECVVSEEAGGVWGAQVGSQGAARIMVAQEDFEKATEILKTHEASIKSGESGGGSEETEDAYWNAPEAFAPFEDKKGEAADESESWVLRVFGPFWIIFFASLLFLVAIGFAIFVVSAGF